MSDTAAPDAFRAVEIAPGLWRFDRVVPQAPASGWLSRAEAALFAVFAATALLAPVWYGSNTPFVFAVHAILFGSLTAAFALLRAIAGQRWPVPFTRIVVPACAIAVVLGWCFLQAQGWMPRALHHPMWQVAAEMLGTPDQGTISADPTASLRAIPWYATAALALFLAIQLLREPRHAELALKALAIVAAAVALYGVVLRLFGIEWILFVPKQAYLKVATATFVNRNSFATYAGVSFIVCLGLAARGWAQREGSAFARFWPLLAAAPIAAGLVASGSRMGMAATLLATLVLALVLGLRTRLRVAFAGLAIVAVVAAAIAAYVTLNAHVSLHFMTTGQDAEGRLSVYRLVWRAIEASPWVGYGAGAFETAFPLFRDDSLPPYGRWEYAHNDWLQPLMTLGVPVGLMLWLVLGWCVWRCFAGAIGRRRNIEFAAIGAAASVLALAHALVDFSLQIQGMLLPFLVVLGQGVAQSWSEAREL